LGKRVNQYTSPSGKNTPKSDINYLKQSIEIDAIAFAYHQMKELFGVEMKIPDAIRVQVREYMSTDKLMSNFCK
jgi:hypothetical protein